MGMGSNPDLRTRTYRLSCAIADKPNLTDLELGWMHLTSKQRVIFFFEEMTLPFSLESLVVMLPVDFDDLFGDEEGRYIVFDPASFFETIETLPKLRSLKFTCDAFAVYAFEDYPKLCSLVTSLGMTLSSLHVPEGMRPKELVVLDFAFGGTGSPERNHRCANRLMALDFVETLIFEAEDPAAVLQFGMSPNVVRLELHGRSKPGTEAEAEGVVQVLKTATRLRTVATLARNTEWLALFRKLVQARPEIDVVELGDLAGWIEDPRDEHVIEP